MKVAQSCPALGPRGLYSPWNSPGQNTAVGSFTLLQWIFPTQESNRGLLHCKRISLPTAVSALPKRGALLGQLNNFPSIKSQGSQHEWAESQPASKRHQPCPQKPLLWEFPAQCTMWTSQSRWVKFNQGVSMGSETKVRSLAGAKRLPPQPQNTRIQ